MSSLRMLKLWRFISIFVVVASIAMVIATALGLVRTRADPDPKDESLM